MIIKAQKKKGYTPIKMLILKNLKPCTSTPSSIKKRKKKKHIINSAFEI